MAKIYYVDGHKGCDFNDGCIDHPFKTINHAAQVALSGDTVIIREGVYRELVQPVEGGRSNTNRITYCAADNEHVVIKGSEIVSEWNKFEDANDGSVIYRAVLPASFFGNSKNPFATVLYGDWLMDPFPSDLHTADVYIDGKSMYEARSLDELRNVKVREYGPCSPWCGEKEAIPNVEDTKLLWFAQVDEKTGETTVYANFGKDIVIAEHLIEVNVRDCCFAPAHIGVNYITIRGIEFCQAATQWAPPTAAQRGMIDTYWSKGWLIEHCHLHDAKTSAISIGKEISTGNNEHWRFKRKPGYQMQLEDVFKAYRRGWGKELVGSHEIRYNVMHDCGQNGVVGHLGCIFSKIHHNKIYNIAMKHEFFGHEIAGIKLHAAIDVEIHHNEIYNCTLGTWLDWQAQGTHVFKNVYYDNYRDIMIEVTSGPCLVENNIFASNYCFDNVAQGTALVNNLFAGTTRHLAVPNRATPYHFAHSTDIAGYAVVYQGDDRVYGNIFIGGDKPQTEECHYGTAFYNGFCPSWEEYMKKTRATGNQCVEAFAEIKEAVYINHNAYLNNAPAYESEEHNVKTAHDSKFKVYRNDDGLYLELDLDEQSANLTFKALDTAALGETRITECAYELPDGSPLVLDSDLCDCQRDVNACHVGPVAALKAGHNVVKIWD